MRVLPFIAAFFCCAQALVAEPLHCANGSVTAVTDDPHLGTRICRAADRALNLFADCGATLPAPVEITTLNEVESNCFGVFHCGEARIEVLTPEGMSDLREDDSVFAGLSEDRFFESIIVHELAHALYDGTDCPFPNCLATSEYLAYSSQIASLEDEDRARIEAGLDMERHVSQSSIVGILAVMSPDTFAERVWRHYSQRDDTCALINGILSGEILFDADYP